MQDERNFHENELQSIDFFKRSIDSFPNEDNDWMETNEQNIIDCVPPIFENNENNENNYNQSNLFSSFYENNSFNSSFIQKGSLNSNTQNINVMGQENENVSQLSNDIWMNENGTFSNYKEDSLRPFFSNFQNFNKKLEQRQEEECKNTSNLIIKIPLPPFLRRVISCKYEDSAHRITNDLNSSEISPSMRSNANGQIKEKINKENVKNMSKIENKKSNIVLRNHEKIQSNQSSNLMRAESISEINKREEKSINKIYKYQKREITFPETSQIRNDSRLRIQGRFVKTSQILSLLGISLYDFVGNHVIQSILKDIDTYKIQAKVNDSLVLRNMQSLLKNIKIDQHSTIIDSSKLTVSMVSKKEEEKSINLDIQINNRVKKIEDMEKLEQNFQKYNIDNEMNIFSIEREDLLINMNFYSHLFHHKVQKNVIKDEIN